MIRLLSAASSSYITRSSVPKAAPVAVVQLSHGARWRAGRRHGKGAAAGGGRALAEGDQAVGADVQLVGAGVGRAVEIDAVFAQGMEAD